MVRAPCCEKVGLNKGRWTTEEDDILKNYILTHGEGSWRSLPKNAGLLRCGKSCRLRWINYLRSNVKRGNITLEEEEIIVQLHSTFGNRWSLIASRLPGRTDNEIKNYWNSHLSRKLHCFRKLMMINSSSERNHLLTDARKAITTTKVVLQQTPRRSRGRTSRAAMKKNKSSATYGKDINRNHVVMNNNDDVENRPDPCNSCLVGDEVEDHCTVLDDIAMVDPWLMSTSLPKSTSIDQQGCSNSFTTYNYIDDDELMRLDDSDQELLSWLMWDNDIGSLEDEQSGKDQEEAMLAWLLS